MGIVTNREALEGGQSAVIRYQSSGGIQSACHRQVKSL